MKRHTAITLLTLSLLCLLGCNWSAGGSANKSDVVHAAEAPPSKWVTTEFHLTVYHHKPPYESASAQGFWQSTSSSKDKQLVWPIAVKLSCDHDEKVCREADASVQLGILQSDVLEYEISSWTDVGIIADDTDEGACGVGHRLAIDFKSNSVTVTDYPKKINATNPLCKAAQDANSYALHGGQLMLYPPAAWDPLEKRVK